MSAILGAIAIGCGDDTAATGTTEAGVDSASSGTGSTSGASSGSSSGTASGSRSGSSSGAAAPDCGALITTTNVATFDSGSAQWACFQSKCGPVLANCATEACCNNSILGALLCVADGGTATNCFTPALTAAMDTDASTCIVTVSTAGTCNAGDGGDAGEGGTPADASDGGTSDASGG